MQISRSTRSLATLLAGVTALAFAASAPAATIYQLLDHPGGAEGANYGLRLDNEAGVQTFGFTPGVYLTLDDSTDSGTITGTVLHHQSGDLYTLSTSLAGLEFTTDGSEWRTNTSDSLYPGVVEDLGLFGDTTHGISEMDLKDKTTLADRIGFNGVLMTLEFLSDGGIDGPSYSIGDQNGSTISLIGLPPGDDPDTIPFMLIKGHRFDDPQTDRVAGIGWLTHVPGQRLYNQDFIFEVGPVVPEPSSLALVGLGGLALLRRRRA